MYRSIRFVLLVLSNLYVRICSAEESNFLAVPENLTFPLKFTAVESELCRRDGQIFLQNLKNYTLWAYRMWDSSAKVPLGLTEGSQYQLGNYDECLKPNLPFRAQYCLTTINILIKLNNTRGDPFFLEDKPNSLLYENLAHSGDPNKVHRDQLFWGFCLPASCNVDDIIYELEEYLNQHLSNHIKEYRVILNNKDCQDSTRTLRFDGVDYVLCITLICLLVFILICTFYDIQYIGEDTHSNIKNKKSVNIMTCFSVKQNFKDLISSDNSNESLKIIYGIRVLLTCGLVMGHSLLNTLNGPIFNFGYIEQINRSIPYIPITRGDLIVDLCFLFGGLLCTYNYLNQSTKRNVNTIRSLLLRYFRCIPVFSLVSLFYATIYYKLGSGPLWNKIIGTEKGYCEQNWWTNILLLNNYLNVENLCVLQGWYLAADFQLSILAVPLNILIKKNNKFCWIIISSVLLVSVAIPFSLVYLGEKAPFFYAFNNFIKNIRQDDYFQSIYIPMHTRAGAYIIGMILGHIYYKLKDSKLNFSVISSILMFAIANIIAAACIISAIYFYDPYIPYNALKSASYAAFSRPAFAVSCCLILFTLSYGRLSMFTKLLRWKIFVPLSKLSFGVYMTHWAIQMFRVGLQRTPVTLNLYYWISQFIFDVAMSYILAACLFVLIENPFNKFIKQITSTNDNSSAPEFSCHQNNETKLTLPENGTRWDSTERIIP